MFLPFLRLLLFFSFLLALVCLVFSGPKDVLVEHDIDQRLERMVVETFHTTLVLLKVILCWAIWAFLKCLFFFWGGGAS